MTRDLVDTRPSFSRRLKQLRAELDLTQEMLADQVGCAIETIRAVEAGRRRPSRAMAERLAEVLHLLEEDRGEFLRLARLNTERDPAQPVQAQADAIVPVPQPVPSPAARLPVPVTPLIGRATEVAAACQRLLDPACRLLTLVGAGGIGKTRLSIQVASELGERFADGAGFVALAPILDPAQVATTIADALGCPPAPGLPPEELLLQWLRGRELLLVLDNMEHLLAATALLRGIMREAPGVRLLVTSRERLRLQGEWVVEVGGLPIPSAESVATIERYDAVLLFVDRARQVSGEFALTPANGAAVVRICRLLAGMPLGIELAAAWVRALTPAEIADEVARGLDFLEGSERDADPRHRSMRAVIEYSWTLLTAPEQQLLTRLSVFQGGWDRPAVAQVAGAALATLTALIDKSLVLRAEVGDGTRYALHELVRKYSAEHLASDPPAQQATEARHAVYYGDLLQRALGAQTGGSSPEAWAELLQNIDNVHAAWMRAATTGDTATVMGMARSLMLLYDIRSRRLDAVVLFERAADALREHGPQANGARGLALGIQGYFMIMVRSAAARPLLEQGVALLEAAGETRERALLLLHLGTAELCAARFAVAWEHYDLAARLAAADDHFIRLWAKFLQGSIAMYSGDFPLAERNLTACLEAWRSQGFSRGMSSALSGLSEVARLEGRLAAAEALTQESLQIGRAAHDAVIGRWVHDLGALALERGDLDEAYSLLVESCENLRAAGDRWPYGRSRSLLVQVEARRGEYAAARQGCAELLQLVCDGAAIMLPEAAYGLALVLVAEGSDEAALAVLLALDGTPGEYRTLQLATQLRADLERRLGPARLVAAATQARAHAFLPWLQELCARPLAPQDHEDPTPVVSAGERLIAGTAEILSPREVEVLQLIAAGVNNATIAQQLVISVHTVKSHVANILAKLDATSRTEAAARARELGLA